MRHHSRLVLVAALSLTLPRLALAQTTRPIAEPVNVASARASFERGVQLLQDSRFAEAATSFEQSYRDTPNPIVLFNLAFAYRGVGRVREAIDAIDRFLVSPGNTAADRVPAARAERARLDAALVRLTLSATPADAQLTIDARPVDANASPIALDPGTHVIDARREGHRPFRRELTLSEGEARTIAVQLVEIDGEARLHVEPSVTTARVAIDGRFAGTGVVDVAVRAGNHQLDITAEGFIPLRRAVRVGGTGVVRVDAVLQRPRSNPWVWLGPVLAVSAIGIGLGAWGIAEATRGEIGPTVPNCWNCDALP
jgi:hypothetical protein